MPAFEFVWLERIDDAVAAALEAKRKVAVAAQ
jgi:hypothetical protein